MGHILQIAPIFKETIWGGTRLHSEYGFDIPSDHTGEAWVLSAHPNGQGRVVGGEYDGWKLSDLYRDHRDLFGSIANDQFPLLIKIIDANRDLSVQVHPDDAYAKEHEDSLGKTECWYVLGAREDTHLVMGHHAKTREELVRMVKEDDYDHLMNMVPIKKGDFFLIPSGTLHAIGSGSLIYEIQQSSDITYRVYDYHRTGADGKERQLHVKQSLEVINVPGDAKADQAYPSRKVSGATETTYTANAFFTVKKYDVEGEMVLDNESPFQLLGVMEGSGSIEGRPAKKGDHYIVCSDQKQTKISGKLEVFVSTL